MFYFIILIISLFQYSMFINISDFYICFENSIPGYTESIRRQRGSEDNMSGITGAMVLNK